MKFSIKLFLISWVLMACGTNAFESLDKQETAQKAAQALEKGNSEDAIDMLESALSDDEENTVYLSLLAMAYAQRAGFDPVEYLLSLSSTDSEQTDTENKNEITQTFALLPAATAANISDIEYAVTLLSQIPADQRITEDRFKLSLFQVFAVSLRTKSFDADGDGDLSPLELANLSIGAALAILETLSAADQNMSGTETSEDNQDVFAEKLSSINSEIGVATGDTDEEKTEKLREFLGTN